MDLEKRQSSARLQELTLGPIDPMSDDQRIPAGSQFLARGAAADVLFLTANEIMLSHDFYWYSPDICWIRPVYAAILLIKLARPSSTRPPELSLTQTQREDALSLIKKFISTLGMNVADAQHSLVSYARVLTRILDEREHTTTGSAEVNIGVGSSTPKVYAGETHTLAPGLETPRKEELFLGMNSLDASFWDNFLLPGMWEITESRT